MDSRKWNKNDTTWALSLFGTAIGAGVLFLPINAGMGGLVPLLVMLVLAFPLTFLTHRALCRFVLGISGKENGADSDTKDADITQMAERYFGKGGGVVLTFLYFFAIFPILLIYSVGITNSISSFMVNQLHFAEPNRLFLSFIISAVLVLIMSLGHEKVVRIMEALVYPFIIILVISALWLIPKWNGALFENISFDAAVSGQSLWVVTLLILPTMVFAFNHSPIISSLAVHCKTKYGEYADEKASKIIAVSNVLMVVVVMFFVFSCAMCLSPAEFKIAKEQNLPILSYLANHFEDMKIFAAIAPVVAFVAMGKSFFGHYLGAEEGFNKILSYVKVPKNYASKITAIVTFVVAWLVAYKDPNVLGIIEGIGGPVLAIILYIMPLYTIYKFPQFVQYRRPIVDIIVVIFGLIAISVAVYSLLFS
ncbi:MULTISPECIES: aromatic amino acid transport family protein [unclassified Helicobacter]|uniref:aromatic amino acid transport family protein n=1 Tax=unclassified Helicobacter TaxID=2593540 RepID=UPI000CF038E4|nr:MULTISPECIES: aromatic amino acid transport family protein [unclassified Helicobacter]